MKIFISVDMEGITGLPDHTFVRSTEHNYERSRKIMTDETNAVIEGAFANGATDILVNDSHSLMNNLLVEQLHPDISLITGNKKPFSMVQELDQTFDGVVLVGYHSRAGQPGVMSHTMTLSVRNIFINDVLVGEIGMNAYLAGYFGVPVLMIAGDDNACQEAKELMPDIATAIVKESISRSAVKTIHPEKSKHLLKETIADALNSGKQAKPFVPPENPVIRVEFNNYGQAEHAAIMPGCEIEKDTTIVRFEAKDMLEAYRAMIVMLNLSSGIDYS